MSPHPLRLRAVALACLCVVSAQADSTAPRWFKGNLHTHSLWSDGNDYPEMIADGYKREGYHFLAMSDHNVLAEGQRWLELKPPAVVKGERVQRGGGAVLEKYLTVSAPTGSSSARLPAKRKCA